MHYTDDVGPLLTSGAGLVTSSLQEPLYDQKMSKIINDQSHEQETPSPIKKPQIKRGLTMYIAMKQKQKEKKNKISQPKDQMIRVIKPEQRLSWDIFTTLVIFLAIVILPVEISFNVSSDILSYYDLFIIAVFTIDMLLNFNTAYQYKGEFVENRIIIAKQYLKLWFWIDLASTFPFEIVVNSIVETDEQGSHPSVQLIQILKFLRLIKVLRLLRVLKLKKMFDRFEDVFHIQQTVLQLFQLIKLTAIMLFVAHWIACIWHFIADQELQDAISNWIDYFGFTDATQQALYIVSLFWASMTMTTVGYGDVVALTNQERILSIIIELGSCCVFAFIMNSIGTIFVTLDQNQKQIRLKMGQANKFLNRNKIPQELQSRVKTYLEYRYENEANQIDEKQALSILSTSIKNEVLQEINFKFIKNSNLAKKLDSMVVQQLPFFLEEQIYGPEECIFLEGLSQMERENGKNFDDRCIYFLIKGSVMICAQMSFTFIKQLETGSFGELGFYTNLPRSASTFSLDFTYVQKLRRSDFLKILKMHRGSLERFMQDKHIIEIENDLTHLDIKCYSCHEINHYAQTCPKLHYIVNQKRKRKIIKNLFYEEKLFMRNFVRNKRVRYNSRGNHKMTLEVQKEIQFIHGEVTFSNQNEYLSNQIDPYDPMKFEIYCNSSDFFVNHNPDVIIKQYNNHF